MWSFFYKGLAGNPELKSGEQPSTPEETTSMEETERFVRGHLAGIDPTHGVALRASGDGVGLTVNIGKFDLSE